MERKGKPSFRGSLRIGDNWTQLLIDMANIQVRAMEAGQKTARKHLLAIMKELEYHCGFRFELIDPDSKEDDPRKG